MAWTPYCDVMELKDIGDPYCTRELLCSPGANLLIKNGVWYTCGMFPTTTRAPRNRFMCASPASTLQASPLCSVVSVFVLNYFLPSMIVIIRVRTTFMLRWITVFLLLRFMSCMELFHGLIRRKMRDLNWEEWNFIIAGRRTFTVLAWGNRLEKREG